MNSAGVTALAAAVASLALLFAPQEPAAGDESFTLFQGFHRARDVEVRVPAGVAERALQRLLAPLADGEHTFTINGLEQDPRAVRVLCGLPSDPGIEPLARTLGLELLSSGFRVLGRGFSAPGDALSAVFEDPERPGQPMLLVLCNDAELLAAYCSELPRPWRPWLRVFDDGDLALECPLAQDGAPREERLVDYRERREEYFASAEPREKGGLLVRALPSSDPARQARLQAYAAGLLGVRQRVRTWFGSKSTSTSEFLVYDHLEDFEHCLGESELVVVNRLHPRIHVLLAPALPDDAGAGLARAIAREEAGEPAQDWLADGLAMAAAGSWWQQPLEAWIGHLARGGLLPSAAELVDPALLGRVSEHVAVPARGLLFRLFVQAAGNDVRLLRSLWKGADPAPMFDSYAQAVSGAAKSPAPKVPVRHPALLRHGVALVEGALHGYSTRATGAALDHLRALEPGPDAVSLSVLAAPEDPLAPLCARRARACTGSASDVALANAVAEAGARDMKVLLSLEVLAQPAGSWADGISWSEEEHAREFFARYRQVALHYALLAELTQVDVFSLGSNLREAARTEPKVEKSVAPGLLAARRAGWAALLADLRAACRRGLTFTARYPGENSEVGFYDQLDFVGLAVYPRLWGAERSPSDDELRRVQRAELQDAIEFALRWNKPLLLVQIGYPSRAASWNRPHVPRGARDVEAQRRYYSCLADVLQGKLENRDVLRGFFLWNWPVDEAAPGSRESDYSLRDKPVESLLPRLFAR